MQWSYPGRKSQLKDKILIYWREYTEIQLASAQITDIVQVVSQLL